MSKHRSNLPQRSDRLFLTDGGIETYLIFHEKADLPQFAAFVLLETEGGRDMLRRYYGRYARLAAERRLGFILESPTWRASADWGRKLGYDPAEVDGMNRAAIALMHELRGQHETPDSPMVVSGCVGPRGDGYNPAALMSVGEARDYHAPQVRAFAEAGADMITAITMTHVEEATGIALAARDAGMPCAISFTVETDGRLPTGTTIATAIMAVDAATRMHPAYYMINCAHPAHFEGALRRHESWIERVRGVRVNASMKSHAELDEAETLDEGDAHDLAARVSDLGRVLPSMNILGGCCGTDHRHVEAMRDAWDHSRAAAA